MRLDYQIGVLTFRASLWSFFIFLFLFFFFSFFFLLKLPLWSQVLAFLWFFNEFADINLTKGKFVSYKLVFPVYILEVCQFGHKILWIAVIMLCHCHLTSNSGGNAGAFKENVIISCLVILYLYFLFWFICLFPEKFQQMIITVCSLFLLVLHLFLALFTCLFSWLTHFVIFVFETFIFMVYAVSQTAWISTCHLPDGIS